MEKPLQTIINKGFRKEMDILFGVGSKVSITQVIYSTNEKIVIVHAKLFVTDFDLSNDVYPTGLVMLITEAWEMFALDSKLKIVHSIDLI